MSEEKEGRPSKIMNAISAVLVSKDEQIKSLESRLKEADEKISARDGYIGKLESHLKTTEQRLSQAEAENETLKLCNKNANALIADGADEAEKIVARLNARLSHLMDVAGKMADTLETISFGKDGDPREWTYDDLDKLIREMVRLAKSGIAEWDGIKEGGK